MSDYKITKFIYEKSDFPENFYIITNYNDL